MMTAGMRMSITTDEGNGRRIGSHIMLQGRMLGLALGVDEVVDEYQPPVRKAWTTVGEPRLLVVGSYRMGFELAPATGGSTLRVFIDYDLPRGRFGRLLGRMLGAVYARWCVRMMLRDAAKQFASQHYEYAARAAMATR